MASGTCVYAKWGLGGSLDSRVNPCFTMLCGGDTILHTSLSGAAGFAVCASPPRIVTSGLILVANCFVATSLAGVVVSNLMFMYPVVVSIVLHGA